MEITPSRFRPAANRDTRWWREDEPALDLQASVDRIRNAQTRRRSLLLDCMRMYGGAPVAGFDAYDRVAMTSDRLAWNVIANVVDTLQAEVVQSRPRPMFLTTGGDYSLRQRVRKMNRFCEGLFDDLNIDALARDVCLDALLFGTGIAHVTSEFGRVVVQRVAPWELFVDSVDGRERKPRTLYRIRYVDRYVLAELYPEHADEIHAAPKPEGEWSIDEDSEADTVLLLEAWRLPTHAERDKPKLKKGERDFGAGRYAACVYGMRKCLVDDVWEDASFPFAFLRWKTLPRGWHGQGVVEQLMGLQIDINCTLDTIQQSHLLSVMRIMVEGNSRVVPDHINDEVGGIVRYFGTPPTVANWQTVHPEMYQWVETQYQKAFQIIGVSQLSAQGMKPAGVTAAIAMRTMLDTQSKRFIRFAKDYEDFHIELAKQCVREMRRAAEDNPGLEVVYRGRTNIERIKWSDAARDMDESSYVVTCFPVSALPSTPGARLQALQELLTAGMIDKDLFLELSDFPDFDSQKATMTAPRELAEQRVEALLANPEVYLPPEPFFDLRIHVMTAGLAYQRAQIDGADEEQLSQLRRYIADCLELKRQAEAPPPPPDQIPPGPPLPPPGPGGPMPPEAMMPPMPPSPPGMA